MNRAHLEDTKVVRWIAGNLESLGREPTKTKLGVSVVRNRICFSLHDGGYVLVALSVNGWKVVKVSGHFFVETRLARKSTKFHDDHDVILVLESARKAGLFH